MKAIDRLIRLDTSPELLERGLGMFQQSLVPRGGEIPLCRRGAIADARSRTGHGSQSTTHPASAREQRENRGIAFAVADIQFRALTVKVGDDGWE